MIDRLVDVVFPRTCGGCGRVGDWCCGSCRDRLGAAAPAPPPPGVDRWVAAHDYAGPARALVLGVKYRERHAAIGWMAAAIDPHLDRLPGLPTPVVTWVPTTRDRRRRRGFDQAELLARCVAEARGWRVAPVLVRRDARSQTGRSAVARRGAPPRFDARAAPSVVLLVDDVATTGATLTAAAAALRRRGAGRVLAATFARARSGPRPARMLAP